MNVGAYLERINYRGSREPTEETLRDLQVAHLLSVPFENLSIHTREPIILEDRALFQKIVEKKRGGFCYELNGLFAALLRELGFDVTMLAARVAMQSGDFGPDFDHMTLMVKLSRPWLVDVGFGDSFLKPLRLDERTVQEQEGRDYQIMLAGEHFILSQRIKGDVWKPQYRFNLESHVYKDYEEMCLYQQTSPDSHFTKGRICSRATEDGRITLSEMRFITTKRIGAEEVRDERTIASEKEYAEVLRDRFGIVMEKVFA